jgi:hypothetical protein
MRNSKLLLILLWGLLGILADNSPSVAQHSKWVSLSDSMYVDDRMSLAEAQETLLQRARTAAIAKVVGQRISSTTMLTQEESGEEYFESFKTMTANDIRGKIVDEDKPTFRRGVRGTDLLLYISYRARVAADKQEPDPGFQVEFAASRSVYQLGEAVEMSVSATQDAYITIFSILPGNRVSVIFPNAYMQNNFLQAHQTRRIPNAEEREALEFTTIEIDGVRAPYGELLYCVATKKPMAFDQLMKQIEYEQAWLKINQMLMRIPRDQRVESYAQYSVVKR